MAGAQRQTWPAPWPKHHMKSSLTARSFHIFITKMLWSPVIRGILHSFSGWALLCSATPTIAEPLSNSIAEKAFDYQPNPAIWRLQDDDTVIFLFGTVHALPEKLKWRSDALNGIINSVDELVLETVAKKDRDTDQELADMLLPRLGQRPLAERVKPENKALLLALARQLKIPIDYLDLLPTWRVPFEIFYADGSQRGVLQDYGVETILTKEFEKLKKPISGVENADMVDDSFDNLSEAEQMVSLDVMLTQIRSTPAESLLPNQASAYIPFADDIAWAKGDISKIGRGTGPESLGTEFDRALLLNRNTAWAEWLTNRMKRPGKLLLAVGSAHFAGESAVQNLLAKRGLTVERIH
jgi:uncharacterized protein